MKKALISMWWKSVRKGSNQYGPIYRGTLYCRKPTNIHNLQEIKIYSTDENSVCEYTTFEYLGCRIDRLADAYMIIDCRGATDEMIGRYNDLTDALNAIDTQIAIEKYQICLARS